MVRYRWVWLGQYIPIGDHWRQNIVMISSTRAPIELVEPVFRKQGDDYSRHLSWEFATNLLTHVGGRPCLNHIPLPMSWFPSSVKYLPTLFLSMPLRSVACCEEPHDDPTTLRQGWNMSLHS